ncbi:hypothetical protein J6590_036912 [Homalodisca vitripennis]|nr:hypothetical protein J6590_036912 [Homalodisca vitripennis]
MSAFKRRTNTDTTLMYARGPLKAPQKAQITMIMQFAPITQISVVIEASAHFFKSKQKTDAVPSIVQSCTRTERMFSMTSKKEVKTGTPRFTFRSKNERSIWWLSTLEIKQLVEHR